MVKGMKTALKVTKTEKGLDLFLDSLLKPKIPVPKKNTTEVKEEKKTSSVKVVTLRGRPNKT